MNRTGYHLRGTTGSLSAPWKSPCWKSSRRVSALALAALFLVATSVVAQETPEENEPPAGGIGVPGEDDLIQPRPGEAGARIDISPGDIEVMSFVRFLADYTGLPVIIDSGAQNAFQNTITIAAPIAFADAEIVTAILEANRFFVYRETLDGREILRIDSTAQAPAPNTEPKETIVIDVDPISGSLRDITSTETLDELPIKPDEIATMVFTLKYTEPKDAITALNSLVTGGGAKPQGRSKAFSLVDVQNSMMVIITAKFGLLNYLRTLLKLIDVPVQEPDRIVSIIQVEHADAEELVGLIEQFLQGRGGSFGATRRPAPRRAGSTAGQAAQPRAGTAASQQGQETNLLAHFGTNKIIVETYSESDLEDINMLVRELDVRFDTRRLRTHIYQVRYLKADEVAQDLQLIVGGAGGGLSGRAGLGRRQTSRRSRGVSRRGRAGATGLPTTAGGQPTGGGSQAQQMPALIVPHVQTNSLLVQAEPEEFAEILHILSQIDIKRRQVFLEAALVVVQSQSDLNFTIELLAGDPDDQATRALFANSFGLTGIDLENFNRVIPDISDPASVPQGGLLAIMDRGKFPALVSFFKTNSDSEVLATPFILADDNMQNVIEILETRFVQNTNTVNVSTVVSQEAEDAGITLDITPTITEDAVFLELQLVVSQFQEGGTVNVLPPKADNSITSAVTAPNGRIFVIGGLTRENRTKSVSKLPILGDIPLIGKLFRSERTTQSASNLYIFLRAHVLTHPDFLDGLDLTHQAEDSMRDFAQDLEISRFSAPDVPPPPRVRVDPDAPTSIPLESAVRPADDSGADDFRSGYEGDVENPYAVEPSPEAGLPDPAQPEIRPVPPEIPPVPPEPQGDRPLRALDMQGLEVDPAGESWLVPIRQKPRANDPQASARTKNPAKGLARRDSWLQAAPRLK